MGIQSITKVSLLVLALSMLTNGKDFCRALAMSGGGSIGAYEAGAIHSLNRYQDPIEAAWDVVSGVSAGSINAVFISLFPPEQGLEMSDWLVNRWSSFKNSDIWKEYKEGLILAILRE